MRKQTALNTHQKQARCPGQPVESSSPTSVGYDLASRTLQVECRKGSVYRYHEVPAFVHQALMKAGSKGRFFLAQVPGPFPVCTSLPLLSPLKREPYGRLAPD
jgi:hypothetical protein